MWGKIASYKTSVGKKFTIKIVALAAKRNKLATEKPGKIKQLEKARVMLRAGGDLHKSEKLG